VTGGDQAAGPSSAEGSHAPVGGVSDDVAPGKRRRRRVVRPGTEQAAVSGVSSDESPDGDEQTAAGANDERLRRDVPPHW
jgi:hypothetical protein